MSAGAPQPAHVPDTLVYDFDLFQDPALVADPHARALEIATQAPPIFWTPRQGGHWVIAGYEANFEAGRDWESFSSEFVPQAPAPCKEKERAPAGWRGPDDSGRP